MRVSVNRDFIELPATFNAHTVEYIVVGAHALAAHGHVRATKALDIWVRPSDENAPFGRLNAPYAIGLIWTFSLATARVIVHNY